MNKDKNKFFLGEDPKPWDEEVDGSVLLDEIESVLLNYIVLPEGALSATALWIMHAWCFDAFEISPLLRITSPTPQCGKTTMLSVIEALVPKPVPASNITPAALFRSIEMCQPTLLIDEADTFFKRSDDLRGIVNAGYTRSSAYVIRTTGESHEPKRFLTWSPKVVAGIGAIAGTTESRSIIIRLKPKLPDEKVEKYNSRKLNLCDLNRKAMRWAEDNIEHLRKLEPTMLPDFLDDRATENWEPLFAIAELAGGDWVKKAVKSSNKLSCSKRSNYSHNVALLADIQSIFIDSNQDFIKSREIVSKLIEMDERPWAGWSKGFPIEPHHVAKLLKDFGISPIKKYSYGRGYQADDFKDAWNRYLPLYPSSDRNAGMEASNEAETHTGTGMQRGMDCDESGMNTGMDNQGGMGNSFISKGHTDIPDKTPKRGG